MRIKQQSHAVKSSMRLLLIIIKVLSRETFAYYSSVSEVSAPSSSVLNKSSRPSALTSTLASSMIFFEVLPGFVPGQLAEALIHFLIHLLILRSHRLFLLFHEHHLL